MGSFSYISFHYICVSDHPEIPQRTGKLKEVRKFDASAFGVHYNQAESMDPMNRILLEKSYEAIIDSGKSIMPQKLEILNDHSRSNFNDSSYFNFSKPFLKVEFEL